MSVFVVEFLRPSVTSPEAPPTELISAVPTTALDPAADTKTAPELKCVGVVVVVDWLRCVVAGWQAPPVQRPPAQALDALVPPGIPSEWDP